jgi:enterochelin esterase-like enzyme
VGPASPLLIILLVACCVALLVTLLRASRLAVQLGCGAITIALAMLSGMAMVNDYYGYYTSWSTLYGDLAGGPHVLGLAGHTSRDGSTAIAPIATGQVRRITLPGRSSGVDRAGLVYLPPQYGDPRYHNVRFPVVELLHGSPGAPSDWVARLQLAKVMNQLIGEHLIGPLVLVMPAINDGDKYEDCVNGRAQLDETYLAADVPADVTKQFRVTQDSAQWGIAGYSSGGYCAANLALRHRGSYGAVGVMDGYYRAADGPAGAALGHDRIAIEQNSPLTVAARLPPGIEPMPSFWITAGTAGPGDYREAKAFLAALHGVTRPSFVVEKGAGHNFYAWSAALPSMLAWMWQQLAPPDLRVAFPVIGPPTAVQVPPVLRPPRQSPVPTATSSAEPSGPAQDA